MQNFQRLIDKARERGCRLQVRFDPEEVGEQYGIKFYPHLDEDAHFYAYNDNLDEAARQILDELRGFIAW